MRAHRASVEQGARGVYGLVRLSADGVPVIWSDAWGLAPAELQEREWQEVRARRLVPGHTLPDLPCIASWAALTNTHLLLEVPDYQAAHVATSELAPRGLHRIAAFVSSDAALLARLAGEHAEFPGILKRTTWSDAVLDEMEDAGAAALLLNPAAVFAELVDLLGRRGKSLIVGRGAAPERIRVLAAAGVYGVIADESQLARDAVDTVRSA